MKTIVLQHGAIHNSFLTEFAEGKVSKTAFESFAIEFFHFSRHFPMVLCSLLINTANEKEAAELTKILTSELGDGRPELRHELLYRDFLRSIGIEPEKLLQQSMLPTTKEWIDTQIRLYSGNDHFAGLGASFGLENMAITMWDQLLLGLHLAKEKWFPNMDMTYFTFHRKLEEEHEDAMEEALKSHNGTVAMQASFKRGMLEVLDAEEKFWLGLSS